MQINIEFKKKGCKSVCRINCLPPPPQIMWITYLKGGGILRINRSTEAANKALYTYTLLKTEVSEI